MEDFYISSIFTELINFELETIYLYISMINFSLTKANPDLYNFLIYRLNKKNKSLQLLLKYLSYYHVRFCFKDIKLLQTSWKSSFECINNIYIHEKFYLEKLKYAKDALKRYRLTELFFFIERNICLQKRYLKILKKTIVFKYIYHNRALKGLLYPGSRQALHVEQFPQVNN
mgnify:FL=1